MKRSGKPKAASRRRTPVNTKRVVKETTAETAPSTDETGHPPSSAPIAQVVDASHAVPVAPPSDQSEEQPGTHAKAEAPTPAPVGPPPPEAAAGEPDARSEEFLGFSLDTEEYCMWIRSVREIIRPTDITPIPRGPVDIMGIISLRGSIVPVFDIRRRLSMPPREPDPRSRIVVVMIDGAPVGMVVDHVTEVIGAEPGSLGPPPTTMGEREAGFVTATLRHRERLIGVLHLERLVAVDPALPRAAA
ncbi:MAG: chemotaxis protein CheW [Nitrospirota bacterium]